MMRALVIGGTGYIGSAICRALMKAGISVSGLSRSVANSNMMARMQVTSVPGDVHEVDRLADLARAFDILVFAPMIAFEDEQPIVKQLLARLAHSGKTFVFTSGTGVLAKPSPDGSWDENSFAEDESFSPAPLLAARLDTERLVQEAAGIRGLVIRPPLVWGLGGSKQVPALFDSAAVTGDVCYFGAGLNLYSHVHVDDLAALYSQAIQFAPAGGLYHAVAGEINFRSLAEAAAQTLGCAVRSVNRSEAEAIWGSLFVEVAMAVNSRSKARRSRAELGWQPVHRDVIDDIRNGSYAERYGDGRMITGLEGGDRDVRARYGHGSAG